MPTQCNPELFDFARAEGRAVVASFDGGAITSDAGALLLGATDQVLGLTRRLAACFQDRRDPTYTEHYLGTLNLCARPHLSSMQSGTTITLPRDIDADLDHWLDPFLDAPGRSTRRKMAPLYVRGLLARAGARASSRWP